MIKVYGQPGCINCGAMKTLLKDNGIPFEYVDLKDRAVDKEEASTVMAESIIVSGGTLPIVRIGEHLFGYKEARNEIILRNHLYAFVPVKNGEVDHG